MKKIITILIITVALAFVAVHPKPSFAIKANLHGPIPSEGLKRGDEITFTITIDTQGESLDTTRIGLTYEYDKIEFLNAIPGDTFSSISVEEIEQGKLVLTGTSDTPFSGTGTFANVKFKIIATEPGETQLCTLFNPEQNTQTTQPTPTPTPTISQTTQPTPTPIPTSLPRSGNTSGQKLALITGSLLFFLPLIGLLIIKKRRF